MLGTQYNRLLQRVPYSCSWETCCRATERHLPDGILWCYLPPNMGECVPR